MKGRLLKIGFAGFLGGTVIFCTACGSSENGRNGAEDREVVLTFMNHTGEEVTTEYENNLIAQFEEEHPNVSIEVQRMGMDDYNRTIQTKMASGDSPDIFVIEPTNLEKYVQNDYLMDLTDTAVADNYEENTMLTYEGKGYAAPQATTLYVVTYNKKAFRDAGVEVPDTLEELYAVCDALEEKNITPFSAGYQESWVLMADAQTEFLSGVLAEDPEAIAKLQNRSKTFTESEEWRGVFERLAKRLGYSQNDPFGTDWSTACTQLATGKAAMIVNGDWTPNNLKGMAEDLELGAFILPVSDNESDNIVAYTSLNGGYSISSTCENPELAIEFLQFFTSKEAGDEYVDQGIGNCIIKGVTAPEGEGPLVDMANIMSSDKKKSIGNNPTNFDDEFRDVFQSEVSRFLLNGKEADVDEVLENLDIEFDRIAGK